MRRRREEGRTAVLVALLAALVLAAPSSAAGQQAGGGAETLRVDGLERPVEILKDRWGVSHVLHGCLVPGSAHRTAFGRYGGT